MNFRRLKHMLLRLSAEEKVMAIGSLSVLVSLFLPWHSMVLNFEKTVLSTGFSGDLGVLGFVVFLFNLLALGFLLGEHLHLRFPQFGFRKEQVVLFLVGESAFLILLAIAIYTKRSLEYTNAEIRFGLYTAMVAAFLSTFAAFAEVQKTKKKEVQEFFGHSDEDAHEPPPPPAKQARCPSGERREEPPAHERAKTAEPAPPSQEKFFYQADPTYKDLNETLKEETAAGTTFNDSTEEESNAPSAETQEAITVEEEGAEAPTLTEEVQQASVTPLEEIAPEPEAVRADETPAPKKAVNVDMGFYNDL